MNKKQIRSGEDNMMLILISIVITGIFYSYRLGISGNDFWWHVKAGEWIVVNKSIPYVDVFSWFAQENNISWVSHEWLSEVVFYSIHKATGDFGIFFLSLGSALAIGGIIIHYNKEKIKNNILLSMLYIGPIILLLPGFFYGRPQLFGFFLFYFTLFCLYRFRENENSITIFFIPLISILWSNLHGGSSNLIYILCFIFGVSSLQNFNLGKLSGEKLTPRQIKLFFFMGIVSGILLMVNPHGFNIITYPLISIKDSFAQSIISEWNSPDAKQINQLLTYFVPLLIVGISLIITDKKVKLIDLMLFLFFAYMFFRSVRFIMLLYIASSFFVFDYFPPRTIKKMESKLEKMLFYCIFVLLIVMNIYSGSTIIKTAKNGELISVALEKEFIDLIKKESPQRIYNDYNFGETLIYNDLKTFIDARADLFAPHNIKDAMSLIYLVNATPNDEIFNPETIIKKYNFDAFIIHSNRSLTVYLKSKPDKYDLLMETKNAVYFKCIQ